MEAAKAYGSARASILGARQAIPRILALAERYGVSCTWATVGLLFFDDRDELLNALPEIRPQYANPELSPYARMSVIGRSEDVDPLHFGRSLIKRIQSCPGQEIAGHTFSHYYTLEDGYDLPAFRADLKAARKAAELLGITLRSIVFPRNQFRPEYLSECCAQGYRSYRGNQRSPLHRSRRREDENIWSRLRRAADNYFPLMREDSVYRLQKIDGLVNISASRFLRPASSTWRVLDNLQLKRICDEMTVSAINGGTYHLWWHPHNFGENTENNLSVLESIFRHYRQLSGNNGMESMTMNDILEQYNVAV